MKKIILEEQEWNEKLVSFDPDSSPETWSFFKKVYTENQLDFLSEFDPENFKLEGIKEYTRLAIGLKTGSYLAREGNFWPKFRIAGDCDFNFNKGKHEELSKIISDDANRELLDYCFKMHHTVLNFSLMPLTGSMNNLKGSLHVENKNELHILPGKAYDRLDTFIFALNEFYSEDSTLVLRYARANEEPLKNYLNKFKGIYDYCARIYFIEDKGFVKKLIESGKKPLSCEKNVKEYMENAKRYWEIRKEKFEDIIDKAHD